LTAEDVSGRSTVGNDHEFSGRVHALYAQIASKQIIDPQTIRIRTASPYPLMLNDLSSIFIVSRNATQGVASADFANGKG
jgi:peptide/nickel transport system substrate-binding protein